MDRERDSDQRKKEEQRQKQRDEEAKRDLAAKKERRNKDLDQQQATAKTEEQKKEQTRQLNVQLDKARAALDQALEIALLQQNTEAEIVIMASVSELQNAEIVIPTDYYKDRGYHRNFSDDYYQDQLKAWAKGQDKEGDRLDLEAYRNIHKAEFGFNPPKPTVEEARKFLEQHAREQASTERQQPKKREFSAFRDMKAEHARDRGRDTDKDRGGRDR